MAFDLAAKLAAVSKLNTGTEQIEYIPFELLDPDPDNFYSLDGLNALADSIATVGILTPLRVRENGERYTITSGHRRRAAVELLIDSGEDWSRGLPCIVDRGESTPEWEELKLIFANRQRVKTSAELSREAERTDELFCALKEKGYDFPGRMQAHVAAAMGVKASKLKRLHAIRSRAQEYVLDAYDNGKINESVAYELSKCELGVQKMIMVQFIGSGRKLDELTAETVAAIASNWTHMCNRACKADSWTNCRYVGVNHFEEGLRRRFAGITVGNCIKGYCCKGCSELAECEACCEKMEAERQQAQDDRERRRAEIEKIPEGYTQTGLLLDRVQRIRRAAEASGTDLRHVFSMRSLNERDLETYLSIINGGPDPTYELDELFDDTDELAVLADDLECSTDFLLGRTEAPEINQGAEGAAEGVGPYKAAAATWSTGTPTEEGWYACLGSWKGIPERTIAYFWDGAWYEHKRKIRVMAETEVTAVYRLPDVEEVEK